MVTSLRQTKIHICRASATRVLAPSEVMRLDYLHDPWDLDDRSWAWILREGRAPAWGAIPW